MSYGEIMELVPKAGSTKGLDILARELSIMTDDPNGISDDAMDAIEERTCAIREVLWLFLYERVRISN